MKLVSSKVRAGDWLKVSWEGHPNTRAWIKVGTADPKPAFFDRFIDRSKDGSQVVQVMQIRCPELSGGHPVDLITSAQTTRVGRVKISA